MDIHVVLSVALALLSTQAENCLENQQCSSCSRTTGYCTTNCFPGYFDLKCKSVCGKNCKYSACHVRGRGIAVCSYGCVHGFFGAQCNSPCTSPKRSCTICPQGCDGTFCHLTSSCVSGCHDSYYGSNCKTCSGRCRYCNRITGRCYVCHDPYQGLDCEFSCEHCSTTHCVQACAPGLYGHTCSNRCSKNCLPNPPACTSECNRSSGECINGCIDGWSGSNCSSQIQCNPTCKGCIETGACVDGCLPGYFGNDCQPCSKSCFNQTCHPNNGTCDNGCIQRQYGQFCTLSCTNCPGGACHPRTGICDEETKGCTTTALVIGLSTVLVLLIVGNLVFLFCRSRRTPSPERDHKGDESISMQVENVVYQS